MYLAASIVFLSDFSYNLAESMLAVDVLSKTVKLPRSQMNNIFYSIDLSRSLESARKENRRVKNYHHLKLDFDMATKRSHFFIRVSFSRAIMTKVCQHKIGN